MSYSPSTFVKDIHYHTWRGPGPRDFTIDNYKYAIGVGWMPALFWICGLVCVFLWCCMMCCCAGKRKGGRLCLRFTCALVAVLAIGACVFGAWTNDKSQKALVKMEDSLTHIVTVFDDATTRVNTINNDLGQLYSNLETAHTYSSQQGSTCAPATINLQTAATDVSTAQSNGNSIHSDIKPVSKQVNDAENWIDKGLKWRNIGTYIALGVAALIALIITICVTVFACDACNCLTHTSINIMALFATWMAALMFFASGVAFLVGIVGADFCMDPSENISDKILKDTGDVGPIVSYYITPCANPPPANPCNSDEPEFRCFLYKGRQDLARAQIAISQAKALKQCFVSDPAASGSIEQLDSWLNKLTPALEALYKDTDCESIYPSYNQGVQEGFCHDLLPPLFQLLGSCLATAVFLILVAAMGKAIAKEKHSGYESIADSKYTYANYNTY